MTKKELMEEIKKILQINEDQDISFEMKISDFWDSMGQIGILAMLKKKTGVVITANELAAIKKVQDIVDMLKGKGIDIE